VDSRRNSGALARTPKNDQSSMAVYISTCYQPDGTPAKNDSPRKYSNDERLLEEAELQMCK